MGLYGDLPQAKSSAAQEDTTSISKQNSWTASSLAPPSRKSSSLFGAPPAVLRAGRGKPTSATQRQQAARRESNDHASTSTPTGNAHSFFSMNVQDEYDPARPNDYEEVRRARERQRVEAEREAERQVELRAQKAAQEAAAKAVLAMQQKPPDPPAVSQASLQAPGQDREAALALSGEEAFARRAMLSRGGTAAVGAAAAAAGAPPEQAAQVAEAMAQNPGARGMDLAARMMEKMGWKSGLGLGRNKQGIVNPLMVQKTDKRGGTIVSSPAAQSPASEMAPPAKKPKGGMIMGTPTRVVLLRNMVGPGEVDPDLEDEVANECSKYGTVQSVMIFEVTTAGYPDDQAVRIFVEFERMEQATKSVVDLGGRFFGGRTVSATFFDEDRFDKQDLGPKPGEAS